MRFKKAKLTPEEALLGLDTVKEMEAMSVDELGQVIVQANKAIEDTKAELNANPKFADAKANVKALSSGYREVKKRQDMKIKFSLKLREAQGL